MVNKIEFKEGRIGMTISVLFFKENDVWIAYCPSLDLSGYDTTEEKAGEDLLYVVKNYLTTQIKNGTLKIDLHGHGWIEHNNHISEPRFCDMIRRKEASKITQLADFRKTNMNVMVSC